MYLNTIRPADVPRGKMPIQKPNWAGLRTDDIDGATPRNYHTTVSGRELPPKPDVLGSKPKPPPYRRERNLGSVPPDLSLTTYDIDKAQPSKTGFKTNRCVNPLTPQYELP